MGLQGQAVDLGRGEAPAEDIVQEEVVELIGTHQVLGLLGDLALDGGKQLGRDGGIQNVLQNVVEGLVLAGVVLGQIPHQVAHQSLGDGSVDTVHAHVVAVVGAPAKGQLAEVAGADDDAAGLVGNIHQDLGALTGLAVLKGDGVVLHVVADVLEMAADGGGDVYGAEGCTHLLGQDHGVILGAVGSSEAGHGDSDDLAGGTVQHLHGKAGDEDGQGRIQAAGKADDGGLGAGMLHPLLQAERGDEQDLPAALVPVLLPLGHEGHGSDIAGELGLSHGEGELHALHIPGGLLEHLGAAALVGQLAHVDLRDPEAALKAVLREHGAVLGDHLVGAEDHVGRGFPFAGAGVEIAAEELGGLHGHKLAAVSVLADDIVGGGEVADDGGAGGGKGGRGGHGGPHILADLDAQHQVTDLGAAEHQLAEGCGLAAEGNGGVVLRGGGKLALLVKFAVVGEVHLGDHAQKLSLLYNRSAVIQFVVLFHGDTHGGDHLQGAGGLQNGGQGFLSAADQGVLVKEVAAGVAGEAQLRQDQDLNAPLFSIPHHSEGLLRVIMAVRKAQLGGAAGNGNKTMFHLYSSSQRHGREFGIGLNDLFYTERYDFTRGSIQRRQLAGDGIDDVALDDHVLGHQGVVDEQVHRLLHGVFHPVKAVEPLLEIHAAVAHHVDMVLRDAPLEKVVDHHVGVDVGHAAVRVADDHDLLHPKLHDGDEEAADHGAEGIGDHAAGIFDDLHVAVFDAQGGGQQLHQPGIHTSQDGQLFVRIFAGLVFFVLFFFHEFFVVAQHLSDHRSSPFP